MTYLGALSHGSNIIAFDRIGNMILWNLGNSEGFVGQYNGPPHQAHDAIRDWITSVTDDWTKQAELRRRALDIRYLIDTPSTKCYLDRVSRKEQSHE